jgi:hypothetical protein
MGPHCNELWSELTDLGALIAACHSACIAHAVSCVLVFLKQTPFPFKKLPTKSRSARQAQKKKYIGWKKNVSLMKNELPLSRERPRTLWRVAIV